MSEINLTMSSLCVAGDSWFKEVMSDTTEERLKDIACYPAFCFIRFGLAYCVLSDEEHAKLKKLEIGDSKNGLYLCIE